MKHVQFAWTLLFSTAPIVLSAFYVYDFVPHSLRYAPGFVSGIMIQWHFRYWIKEFYK